MAITVNNGGVAASNGNVASQACASFNEVNTGRILIAVVLLDITKTVVSITHNGTTETTSFIRAVNGTNVRLEYWRVDNPATKTGFIITANFSAAVTAGIAAWQYTGDIAVETSDADINNTGWFPYAYQNMVGSTDYGMVLLGFNGVSTDTITANVGTLRASAVGASATAAGIAIVDITQNAVVQQLGMVRLNNSREWIGMPVGLKATTQAFPANNYTGRLPIENPYVQANADLGIVITKASAKMPTGGGGGIIPPSGDGQIFPPPMLQGS